MIFSTFPTYVFGLTITEPVASSKTIYTIYIFQDISVPFLWRHPKEFWTGRILIIFDDILYRCKEWMVDIVIYSLSFVSQCGK